MRKRVLAALATVVIAVGGGIAWATGTAGELRYIEESKAKFLTPGEETFLAVKAHCPRGRHVTGGGYSGNFASGYVQSSVPFDDGDADDADDDGWYVATVHDSGSHEVFVKAFAICDD